MAKTKTMEIFTPKIVIGIIIAITILISKILDSYDY